MHGSKCMHNSRGAVAGRMPDSLQQGYIQRACELTTEGACDDEMPMRRSVTTELAVKQPMMTEHRGPRKEWSKETCANCYNHL
jgi:hypothetical protein